ncbi:PTS sugar transporter subunit IIA [Paeniglutamicibacter sp. R2-26]|uniref:PTS sugar transporter subunit IIA n=1 Tax=Paeniglutamicibacter sp. R2-26 TaxID=3144417 RepID=UPI003EE78C38
MPTSQQQHPQQHPAPEAQPATTADLVVLELDAPNREAAVAALGARLFEAGRITDLEGFLAEVDRREHQLATGLPGGIGIAHARSAHTSGTSIAVGVVAYGKGVDFGAVDGDARVVLLLATPATSYSQHLTMLAALARSLSKDSFRTSLHRANDAEVIAELVNSTVDFSTV